MRNTPAIALAVALACGAASGAGMTRQDYEAAKKRIVAEYEQQRQKCGPRLGNDRDLCVALAHGSRDVAKAELEAAYKPSSRTNYDAAIARSKAAYTVAKQECGKQSGADKKACMKDADGARARANAEAKSAMTAAKAEETAKPPGR